MLFSVTRFDCKRMSVRGRFLVFFFFQAEDGIRDADVTGVQTCALPISKPAPPATPVEPPLVLEEQAEKDLVPVWGRPRRFDRGCRRRGFGVGAHVHDREPEIERASCREREENSGGAGALENELEGSMCR